MTGSELRIIRSKLGMSQTKLGKILGVHWKTMHRYETQYPEVPTAIAFMVSQLLKENENDLNAKI
ncbi:MAG TPA: hypothetical protein VHZ76_00870 [Gammaproteobacteria bacterium]|jgi:DNA-binding XRE family transcriptional regulator|nr:hypothetical protein [Gammaproteobacteria bacterium]